MNQTHIHLIITHLPIFGSLLGGLVLAYGLLTKTKQTLIAAYILLIISSLGAVIAYLTGEGAEEGVEKIPGIVKNMIGQHEDVALIALISLILLGISSIFGFFFAAKQSALTFKIALIILIICFISFGIISYTGYLGGKIRHTEIDNKPSVVIQPSKE
ncbi:MAG: hypothetical protein Q8918_04615 [Bacteroidota bacterium]|nr:hypothetical protein [Bacteroidota bacterium]